LKLYEYWNGTTSAWTQLVTTWPASSVSKLLVTTPTSVTSNITASEAVLTDSNGFAVKHANVNVTPNSTTTRANGCDVGTRAVSTSYDIYLISNGVTVAGLFVVEGNAPTLPAGYTFSKRVSWQRTDGSSNFLPMAQRGTIGFYVGTQVNLASSGSLSG